MHIKWERKFMLSKRTNSPEQPKDNKPDKFNFLDFLRKKPTAFSMSNSQDSLTVPSVETAIIPEDPIARCYVTVAEATPRTGFPIKTLFNGEFDKSYKSEPFFTTQCEIYGNRQIASDRAAPLGKGPSSVYVLEMGYTKEEVKQLAKRGLFSKGIVSAIDAKKLTRERENITTDAFIKNENFETGLLNNQQQPFI
jgi:hypothetical protein